MKLLKRTITDLLIVIMLFLMSSFFYVTFDISKWSDGGRYLLIVLWIISIFITYMIPYDENE